MGHNSLLLSLICLAIGTAAATDSVVAESGCELQDNLITAITVSLTWDIKGGQPNEQNQLRGRCKYEVLWRSMCHNHKTHDHVPCGSLN